ncbi:MAG TPA: hypothetical protein VFN35_28305, partial [Ktedonobacteraceae bacterium]|nr:hypothetical protein [Ktedonobacteraceae bacterium]
RSRSIWTGIPFFLRLGIFLLDKTANSQLCSQHNLRQCSLAPSKSVGGSSSHAATHHPETYPDFTPATSQSLKALTLLFLTRDGGIISV